VCVIVLIACRRKWDAGLIDALLPQLLPQLHSNTVRSCDVSWKVAAVQGFLSRFHLQVYHHLSHVLVMLRHMLLIHYLCLHVCACVGMCIRVYCIFAYVEFIHFCIID